jgi:DNA topoisomerase-1
MERCCLMAVRAAAEALGNTPAVCRKFYVHPKLCESLANGDLAKVFNGRRHRDQISRWLSRSETAVLKLMDLWRQRS